MATTHNKPILYWIVIAAYVAAIVAASIYFTELRYWILAAAAMHIACSLMFQEWNEEGGIFFLLIPVQKTRNGPNFAPFGLMQMGKVSSNPRQRQFPDEPERVFHGQDNEDLPFLRDGTQMVRPMRVVTGGPIEGYKSHLNIQATTKITGSVTYKVSNFFDFWLRFSGWGTEAKYRDAERQMNDTFRNTVKEEWEQLPVGKIIEEGARIKLTLEEALELLTNTWGIDIEEVTLDSPDLGYDLSKSLTEVGRANAAAEVTRTAAAAAADASRADGQAKADNYLAMETADINADTLRFEKMEITGREMFAADTAARVIGDKDKLVFGAKGLEELLASGAVIIEALKPKNPDEPETPAA